ncbi:MAG: 4-hydroxybenzoate octaprenyltransferase [Chromatiales bacterium]|jgi:4-hydroxybenzoate polyprenyltransferase|nr:4-hydroxybenzoate octaprenyltransferase [Chromatiales bacterium]MDX9767525.1 4-hydroxybenzoate octaprenyltransferase [Ectothiorhodospiraceae bacterium]
MQTRLLDTLLDRAREYALLTRLHRPIGILLLLWPMLWALWIAAEGVPDLLVLFVFTAGVVLMRSAGCAINDYADRHFDPHVTRTRERPVAAGRVSPREALGVFAVLSLIAFLLVLLLDRLTILMSFVAVALAATYPFMKRFHYLPQVHLGAAFGWAIPMTFTAQTGALPPPGGWLLFLLAVLWAVIYDTFYAMADREDDLRIGVKSSAILFGEGDRLIVGVLQVLMLIGLVLVGRQFGLGIPYYLGLCAGAGLFVYQQYLVRHREPAACFRAFLNNHWFGTAVFAGIALDLL